MRSQNERWQSLVDIITALAGGVLLLYALGGVVVIARLSALGLPTDAAVSGLPKSSLLVASLRAGLPGFLAAALLWWITRDRSGRANPPARRDANSSATEPTARVSATEPVPSWHLVAFWIALLAAITVIVILEGPVDGERLAVVAIAGLGLAIGTMLFRRRPDRPRLRGDLALVVLFAPLLLALCLEFIPPTRLDYVSVRLKDGGVTDGHYLASDSASLYLAPNVLDRTVGDISTIPRQEIKGFRVERHDEDELRLVHGWKEKGQDSSDEERAWDLLRSVRLDEGWVYPPIIPWDSAGLVINLNLSEFTDGKWHPRNNGAASDEGVPLRDVLTDPQLYTGRAIRTHGQVTRTANIPHEYQRQVVVVRPGKAQQNIEAYCNFTFEVGSGPKRGVTPAEVEADAEVHLRAVIVGWGTYETRSGDPADVTALLCSRVSRAS